MLLTTVVMGFCLQSPQDMKIWVDRGYDPVQPNAHSVSGSPELTRKAAWASVTERAVRAHDERLAELAAQTAHAESSSWLPEFVVANVVREWSRQQARRIRPEVLDRDLLVREHGFGRSYQAFLLLDALDPNVASRSGGLSRRLARAERVFLAKCGGTVGLWALLAFVLAWIDRLTRGYMTGRLYLIGAALGVCGPILLVLL